MPPVSDKILFNIFAGNSIRNIGLFPTDTTVSEASLGIEIRLIIWGNVSAKLDFPRWLFIWVINMVLINSNTRIKYSELVKDLS